MENQVSKLKELGKYYLPEFELFDGEDYIKFNIIEINLARREVTVAITDRGKISVITYDIAEFSYRYCFEYGVEETKVYLDDFEEVK